MKRTKIIYWISTVIASLLILFVAVPEVISQPDAIKLVTGMGYPAYFTIFTGVAKVLGVIAILIPGFARVKEWAYAGLTFDLIAVTYSSIMMGATLAQWPFLLIWFIPLLVSYFYYHKKLKEAGNDY